MSTNSKVLQLLRNAELSPNKESAINALNGKLNELKDGQILINRYGDGSKCIIGSAYVKDDTLKLFYTGNVKNEKNERSHLLLKWLYAFEFDS